MSFASAENTGVVHVKAWIDGSDYIYIQQAGGSVWYVHKYYTLPGYHSPDGTLASPGLATVINGNDWYPDWSGVDPENPDEGATSSVYLSSTPPTPLEWSITGLTVIHNGEVGEDDGRDSGAITIETSPTAENSYTATILLNDDDTGGAGWYEFELTWTAPSINVLPEYPLGTIFAVTVFFAAFGTLAIVKHKRLHINQN